LHSRCIEYPFAASQVYDCNKILDVGTTKSDPTWIAWLESLPIEVHAIDYDKPNFQFKNITFHESDLRDIPIDDNSFDIVLAVSVIEHIGLEDPQVFSSKLPKKEIDGDIKAVKELIRIIKPGGRLVMTLPFGKPDVIATDKSSRIYTLETIKEFGRHSTLTSLDYYEYQYSKYLNVYPEYIPQKRKNLDLQNLFFGRKKGGMRPASISQLPKHFGVVTWRKILLEDASATHYWHTDGIVCGIWKK
jgi:SAM-dependent methyltransferase